MTTYLQTYVLDGGPLMVVLILCSILLVALFVQSMIRFRSSRVVPDFLRQRAEEVTNVNDRLAYARDLEARRNPLARTLHLTLRDLDLRAGHRPHHQQLELTVREAVAHVVDDLYEMIGGFAIIYTVAPLLGLLGTILGMISAFREFALGERQDLTALSEGIQQALVTTLWGLGIAIGAFVAAQYFQSRIRRLEREALPERTLTIVNALFAHPPAAGAQPRPAAAAAAGGSASAPTLRQEPAARSRSEP